MEKTTFKAIISGTTLAFTTGLIYHRVFKKPHFVQLTENVPFIGVVSAKYMKIPNMNDHYEWLNGLTCWILAGSFFATAFYLGKIDSESEFNSKIKS